ncbi:MAG: FmdB family zinc ribbon protein [Phycisphaerales bacterium]
MPTYDYACRACGHEFELFQSMSAPVKRKCPECGKLQLERLLGAGAGVIFKGSGFYETDYRSDSYKKAADSDGKPASKDTASGADKSADASKNGAAKESSTDSTKKQSESKSKSTPKPKTTGES